MTMTSNIFKGFANLEKIKTGPLLNIYISTTTFKQTKKISFWGRRTMKLCKLFLFIITITYFKHETIWIHNKNLHCKYNV